MSQDSLQDELFAISMEIPNATYAVKRKFMGKWHIRATSEWEYDFLSLVERPELEVTSSGYGRIQFGAFNGTLDAMKDEFRPDDVMQFSFRGFDEDDEVNGRGCARIENGLMVGRILFHRGMISNFEAEKLPRDG
ncbi:MAG: hypothetical protein AAGH89_12205 [Verrucomicrobiota bacterium]